MSETTDARQLISLRVPRDLLDRVEETASSEGRTRTDIIVDALTSAYMPDVDDGFVDCA